MCVERKVVVECGGRKRKVGGEEEEVEREGGAYRMALRFRLRHIELINIIVGQKTMVGWWGKIVLVYTACAMNEWVVRLRSYSKYPKGTLRRKKEHCCVGKKLFD